MILITGDTHGMGIRVNEWEQITNEEDYVIVTGDFGYLFYKSNESWRAFRRIFRNIKCTILFIDGNHENFDWLNSFDVDTWNGGKVHKILGNKVIHLMRGQVYNICGKTFFTFGGGRSVDVTGGILEPDDPDLELKRMESYMNGKHIRINHVSWWKEEMPTEEEKEEAIKNLEKHNYTVDYVLTHAMGSQWLDRLSLELGIRYMEPDNLTDWLETIESKIHFEKWYFGHYHLDKKLDNKHEALYYNIAKA